MESVENQTAPRTSVWMTLAPALIGLVGVVVGGFLVSSNSARLEREKFHRETRQASVEERATAYREFARAFDRLVLDGPEAVRVLLEFGFWVQEGAAVPEASVARTRAGADMDAHRKGLFVRYRELVEAGTVLDFVGSDRAKKLATESEDAARDYLQAVLTDGSPEEIASAVGAAIDKVAIARAAFDTVLGLELRELGLPLDESSPLLDRVTEALTKP